MKRMMGAGAALVFLFAFGCGESAHNASSSSGGGSTAGASGSTPNDAGQSGSGGVSSIAGSSGADSTSAGSDSGGATTTSTLTETEACVAYMEGYCKLLERCEPHASGRCHLDASLCPDLFFSPGSTRTIEGEVACGKELATWSCARWSQGDLPSCMTNGTRKPGETCRFNNQCASAYCMHASAGDCGQCIEVAARGGACDLAAPMNPIGCPVGQDCMQKSCRPDLVIELELGDPCSADSNRCGDGTVCNNGHCEAPPPFDGKCDSYADCPSARCNEMTGQCVPVPGAGEPCIILSPGWICGANTVCDGKLCQPVDGAACPDGVCGSGYHCSEGFCRPPSPSGTACEREGDCAEGVTCVDKVCKTIVGFHEACDDTVSCRLGATCVAGKCEPQPNQGLFEKVCQ